MTDDITRALRRQMAQLQATQTYLRVAASKALPFPNVWRAEARAEDHCHELLSGLGMQLGRIKRAAAGSFSTSVRPVSMTRRQTRPPAPQARASAAPAGRRSGLVSFDDPAESAPAPQEEGDGERTVVAQRPAGSSAPSTRGTPVRSSRSAAGAPGRSRTGRAGAPVPGSRRATPSQPVGRGGSGPQARWGRGPDARTPGLAGRTDVVREGLVSIDEDVEAAFDTDEEKLFGDEGATVVGDAHVRAAESASPSSLVDESPDGVQTPTPAQVHPSSSVEVAPPAETPTPAVEESDGPPMATSGLYGGSVPSVRVTRPRAAAVQLNRTGVGGRPVGSDDDIEPIEIGAADDDEEFEAGDGGGFSVTLQQDEDWDDDLPDIESEEDEDLELISEVSDEPEMLEPEVSQEEIDELYADAEKAVAGGDLGAAADYYSDVIDADPDHVDAHVARGRVFLDLGDYSRAMSDFMVAEEIANDNPEPQVAIGDLFFARKDYRRAIEHFNAALELDPEHAMAFCRRGISHYYRKNYNDALEDLLHAQKLRPDIPNLTTYVAMAQKKKQRKKRP